MGAPGEPPDPSSLTEAGESSLGEGKNEIKNEDTNSANLGSPIQEKKVVNYQKRNADFYGKK